MNETVRREFSSRYSAALRTHFGQGGPDTMEQAHALGELAASMGIETLGLARIHEEALTALVERRGPGSFGEEMRKRVTDFFTAAITPVENKRRLAADAPDVLIQLNQMLATRTLELADSQKKLERGISARKDAKVSLEATKKQSRLLLGEARDLESKLQNLARSILAAHEGERKDRSLILNVGIAQALLGIHVHLLALDREIAVCGSALKKGIAKAQRIVDMSIEDISRLVREFGISYNA